MCGKHSTPKFCMICLICCSKYITSAWSFVLCFMRGGSFGIGKTHHRVSVKRRFEEEALNARGPRVLGEMTFETITPSGVGVLFRLRRVLIAPRERGAKRETAKEQKREQKRRTMETSFVVSAAFWAPVVTESQNDMAVFLAIRVWTEMVADFL